VIVTVDKKNLINKIICEESISRFYLFYTLILKVFLLLFLSIFLGHNLLQLKKKVLPITVCKN